MSRLVRAISRELTITGLFLILISTTFAMTNPTCESCVSVSPGKYDLPLGVDFPSFNMVKLLYPNSTILTNSTGDLLFSVSLTSNGTSTFYNSIDIYIPPDFTGLSLNNMWTSFTNNYDHNSFTLSTKASGDRIAPSYWDVSIRNITVINDASRFLNDNAALVSNRTFVANRIQYVRLFNVSSPQIAGRYFFKVFVNGTSIGAPNFPTIVVKGSRDPAHISGTLRDAGNIDSTKTGMPVQLPDGFGARVLAVGYDDQGRTVSAQAFINSTASGQYTLFGVAPGTYNITAYAAGFIPTTRSQTVSVHATQSLEHIDIHLPHSVNITGIVLSEDSQGNPIPWGNEFGFAGPQNRSIVISAAPLAGSIAASTPAPYGASLFTNPTATTFDFSINREVGFDGRIPQDYANYTSGLAAGDYILTASVSSYIQIDETRVHVGNETNRVHDTIRLIRSGYFLVTIHFRDLTISLVDTPLSTAGTLTVTAYDSLGIPRGSNTTNVPTGATNATIEIQGQSQARSQGISALFSSSAGLFPGNYHIVATLSSSRAFVGFANVGIRQLYYQLTDYSGLLGFGITEISLPLFRGGGISLTFYSIDAENPHVLVPWAYGGAPITTKIIDSLGNVYQANSTQPLTQMPQAFSNATFFYSGLLTDTYVILVQTLGYTQVQIPHVQVRLGGNSDARVELVLDPRIDLTLVFKTEDIFSATNSSLPFLQPINNIDGIPLRIEVYDATDASFVGANFTYVPDNVTTYRLEIVGFRHYSGNPWQVWSGFYDTTDGTQQDDGGFAEGRYVVRVWVGGYYARGEYYVDLPKRGTAYIIGSLDRASRISGTVVGLDFYQQARPLSWAVVDAEPGTPLSLTTSTVDGFYQLWAPSGQYKIGISLQGYDPYSADLYVPSGSGISFDVTLPG